MKLERMILEVLALCDPYLLPERSLMSDVNLMRPEPALESEMREALASLERKRQIVGIRNEDRGVQWKITGNGKARMAE